MLHLGQAAGKRRPPPTHGAPRPSPAVCEGFKLGVTGGVRVSSSHGVCSVAPASCIATANPGEEDNVPHGPHGWRVGRVKVIGSGHGESAAAAATAAAPQHGRGLLPPQPQSSPPRAGMARSSAPAAAAGKRGLSNVNSSVGLVGPSQMPGSQLNSTVASKGREPLSGTWKQQQQQQQQQQHRGGAGASTKGESGAAAAASCRREHFDDAAARGNKEMNTSGRIGTGEGAGDDNYDDYDVSRPVDDALSWAELQKIAPSSILSSIQRHAAAQAKQQQQQQQQQVLVAPVAGAELDRSRSSMVLRDRDGVNAVDESERDLPLWIMASHLAQQSGSSGASPNRPSRGEVEVHEDVSLKSPGLPLAFQNTGKKIVRRTLDSSMEAGADAEAGAGEGIKVENGKSDAVDLKPRLALREIQERSNKERMAQAEAQKRRTALSDLMLEIRDLQGIAARKSTASSASVRPLSSRGSSAAAAKEAASSSSSISRPRPRTRSVDAGVRSSAPAVSRRVGRDARDAFAGDAKRPSTAGASSKVVKRKKRSKSAGACSTRGRGREGGYESEGGAAGDGVRGKVEAKIKAAGKAKREKEKEKERQRGVGGVGGRVVSAGGGWTGGKGSIESRGAKVGETKEVGLGIAGYGRDTVLRFMQEKRERERKEERAERKAKEEEELRKKEEMAKVVGHYRALSMDASRRGRERSRPTVAELREAHRGGMGKVQGGDAGAERWDDLGAWTSDGATAFGSPPRVARSAWEEAGVGGGDSVSSSGGRGDGKVCGGTRIRSVMERTPKQAWQAGERKATPERRGRTPHRQQTPEKRVTSKEQATPNKKGTPNKQQTPDKKGTPNKQQTPDKKGTPNKQQTPDKKGTPNKQQTPDKKGTPGKAHSSEKKGTPKRQSPSTVEVSSCAGQYVIRGVTRDALINDGESSSRAQEQSKSGSDAAETMKIGPPTLPGPSSPPLDISAASSNNTPSSSPDPSPARRALNLDGHTVIVSSPIVPKQRSFESFTSSPESITGGRQTSPPIASTARTSPPLKACHPAPLPALQLSPQARQPPSPPILSGTRTYAAAYPSPPRGSPPKGFAIPPAVDSPEGVHRGEADAELTLLRMREEALEEKIALERAQGRAVSAAEVGKERGEIEKARESLRERRAREREEEEGRREAVCAARGRIEALESASLSRGGLIPHGILTPSPGVAPAGVDSLVRGRYLGADCSLDESFHYAPGGRGENGNGTSFSIPGTPSSMVASVTGGGHSSSDTSLLDTPSSRGGSSNVTHGWVGTPSSMVAPTPSRTGDRQAASPRHLGSTSSASTPSPGRKSQDMLDESSQMSPGQGNDGLVRAFPPGVANMRNAASPSKASSNGASPSKASSNGASPSKASSNGASPSKVSSNGASPSKASLNGASSMNDSTPMPMRCVGVTGSVAGGGDTFDAAIERAQCVIDRARMVSGPPSSSASPNGGTLSRDGGCGGYSDMLDAYMAHEVEEEEEEIAESIPSSEGGYPSTSRDGSFSTCSSPAKATQSTSHEDELLAASFGSDAEARGHSHGGRDEDLPTDASIHHSADASIHHSSHHTSPGHSIASTSPQRSIRPPLSQSPNSSLNRSIDSPIPHRVNKPSPLPLHEASPTKSVSQRSESSSPTKSKQSEASPTRYSPTKSISQRSEASPTKSISQRSEASPTKSISQRSEASPTKSISQRSEASPTKSISQRSEASPTKSVSQRSEASPTKSISQRSEASPTKSVSQRSEASPTKSISQRSEASPTKSVSHRSEASPTKSVSERSEASPMKSISQRSEASPTKSVSQRSEASPTKSVSERSEASPVKSQTASPTLNRPWTSPRGDKSRRSSLGSPLASPTAAVNSPASPNRQHTQSPSASRQHLQSPSASSADSPLNSSHGRGISGNSKFNMLGIDPTARASTLDQHPSSPPRKVLSPSSRSSSAGPSPIKQFSPKSAAGGSPKSPSSSVASPNKSSAAVASPKVTSLGGSPMSIDSVGHSPARNADASPIQAPGLTKVCVFGRGSPESAGACSPLSPPGSEADKFSHFAPQPAVQEGEARNLFEQGVGAEEEEKEEEDVYEDEFEELEEEEEGGGVIGDGTWFGGADKALEYAFSLLSSVPDTDLAGLKPLCVARDFVNRERECPGPGGEDGVIFRKALFDALNADVHAMADQASGSRTLRESTTGGGGRSSAYGAPAPPFAGPKSSTEVRKNLVARLGTLSALGDPALNSSESYSAIVDRLLEADDQWTEEAWGRTHKEEVMVLREVADELLADLLGDTMQALTC